MIIQTFSEKGTPGTEAIVVVFDLEGFSRFFTQQDVHLHAPDYLNVVLDAFHEMFRSKRPWWISDADSPSGSNGAETESSFWPLPEPSFAKFMGDGGLYIWTATSADEPFEYALRVYIMNGLWLFKDAFQRVVERAREEVPLVNLPERIRFGVTRGTVYGLRRPNIDGPVDYIGFTINLAARFQTYCRELGFITSARLKLKPDDAIRMGWVRKKAIALRGFEPEFVYVDRHEFENLDQSVKDRLFE